MKLVPPKLLGKVDWDSDSSRNKTSSKGLLECPCFYVFDLHKLTFLTPLFILPFTSVQHLVQPCTKKIAQQQ